MADYKVSYAPPKGKPHGTNFAFKIGTKVVIPLLNLVGKKVWRGGENIPKSGKTIVASNHLSYLDVLFLTHFLFRNGRAPRYIGKEGVFKVPVIGKIILAAGMVPVARESKDASKALDHALRLLDASIIRNWALCWGVSRGHAHPRSQRLAHGCKDWIGKACNNYSHTHHSNCPVGFSDCYAHV